MLAVAARELDRAFQRCSSDLDVIASKLENEFENNPSFSRVRSWMLMFCCIHLTQAHIQGAACFSFKYSEECLKHA
jgi:hypothetical protein